MKKKTPTKKDLNYVEVIENKLISEEKLDTLVRLPFTDLFNIDLVKLLQNLSVLAIGTDDSGQFKIDKLVVQLAGTVDEDIIFRVAGILQKFEVETKKLPKVISVREQKKTNKLLGSKKTKKK